MQSHYLVNEGQIAKSKQVPTRRRSHISTAMVDFSNNAPKRPEEDGDKGNGQSRAILIVGKYVETRSEIISEAPRDLSNWSGRTV